VRRLFRLPLRTPEHIEADARDELRAFLGARVDDLVARGWSPENARAEALSRLGLSLDETTALLNHSATDRERRMRFRDMMSDVAQDFRYAARTLRRDAGFSAFALLIIALGIAASVTVFSVANAILLRPLPFHQPNDLVWIANGGQSGLSGQTTQVNQFLDLRAQNRSFSEVAAYFAFYGVGDTKLTGKGESVRVSTVPVSQNFFPLLGVRPIIGRGFTDAESAWNGPRAVLLSHDLWERRFASDPSIVGRTITLNDQSTTVIGVLPASFDFGTVFAPGAHIDIFSPFPLTAETNRWGNTLAIIGRLKPGVALGSAAADVGVVAQHIAAANPRANSFNPTLTSLRDHVSGRVQAALTILLLAVGVVMLIVCANLSNLLLARATTRQKEMAIRAALGAGRRRLVRQMLTESIVLSAGGAAVGLALALIATRSIAHMSAVSLPLLDNVRVDGLAVLCTVLLALASGLAFGMAPALQIPESSVNDSLKVSGRATTHGKRGQAMRRGLVVAEIALACVLIVGSGLLIRSFINVLDVELGFRPDMVAALRVDPDRQQITSLDRLGPYLDDVMRLAKTVPGIQSVGVSDGLPLGSNRSWDVRVPGREYKKGEAPDVFVRIASEGFIDAMGMTLRGGRDFTTQDAPAGEPVIIINETMARTLWPGESAIGKSVIADKERRVVGVVGDVRHLALEQAAGLEMYLPIRQTGDFSSVNLVVRTKLPPSAIASGLRLALASVSPNLPTNEIRTLGQVVDRAISPRRFFTMLLGAFALFALLLALLGIYGVISYTVSHRTQEIGVRIAVGASARNIQVRIIRETLGLAATGMLFGTAGSWIAARTLGGMLFGVTSTDPITFAAMLVVITLVATLSGYLPARRASRIDPLVALRSS
jgi:putative ABC transport system permease protein